MTKIGLISDTHSHLDCSVAGYFKGCDEIWHAGDFGVIGVAESLAVIAPLRGVFGNIDGQEIRAAYPESLHFTCEDVHVFMQHIGGYPGRYAPGVKTGIEVNKSNLFISGHSHILKIMYDQRLQCLHMNPGAAGKQGWHKVKTLIRFSIDGKDIKDAEIVEIGPR